MDDYDCNSIENKIRAKAAATKKKRRNRRKEQNRRFYHLYDSIKDKLYVGTLLSWDGLVENYLQKAEECTEMKLRGDQAALEDRKKTVANVGIWDIP